MRAYPSRRGPLRHIVLAQTGAEVRACVNCQNCESLHSPGMDLTFGEIMRAVERDDPCALTNRTLWVCDEVLESFAVCQGGIDIQAVIHVLRSEAILRGHPPHQ